MQKPQWNSINISLPKASSHQVIGYYPDEDRVYLLGGKNMDNEYWSLEYNKSYDGWSRNSKLRFEDLRIVEYTQSYYSSKHNVIYIKTNRFIHIFDMELDYFNLNVIELPEHLSNGCLSVYYEPSDVNIEYLIIIGSKMQSSKKKSEEAPTTWIYKVDQSTHNITFFDIGPDLIGQRENHCCAVLDGRIYAIGGLYNENQTRFIEEWQIDIDTDYVADADTKFNNFTNIDTMIDTNIAHSNLPQFGHRCVVNEDEKQIYVIGGITDEHEQYFNYSRYVFILERFNGSLYEVNYRESEEEQQRETANGDDIHFGKILPSLPMEMAYTSALIDKYGYLNLFGGELSTSHPTNKWLRINTKYTEIGVHDDRQNDVIWRNHTKHNHNEQWALMILLVMIILIAIWFKCIGRISRLSSDKKGGRGDYSTAYDEITASDADDLDDTEENDNDINEYASDDNSEMMP